MQHTNLIPIYSIEIAGFEITMHQHTVNRFTVTYGQQTMKNLDYVTAAKELGLCIMHALACQGDLETDGE